MNTTTSPTAERPCCNVPRFAMADAVVGEVGGQFHLRWRIRLLADRRGPGWRVIDQQVYADSDEQGRVVRLDLLCTGLRPADPAVPHRKKRQIGRRMEHALHPGEAGFSQT